MNQSENINELFAALAKAQAEMQNVTKNRATQAGSAKYNWADIGAVFDLARDVLSKYNIAIMQPIHFINDKYHLETKLAHSSGQWINSIIPLFIDKPGMHGWGGGVTYMRRYALCSFIGLAQEDDDGKEAHDATKDKKIEPSAPKAEAKAVGEMAMISKDQHDVLAAIFEDCPVGYKEDVLKSMKITLDKLPAILFDKFKAKILEERAKHMIKVPNG